MMKLTTLALAAGMTVAGAATATAQSADEFFSVVEKDGRFSTLVKALRASDADWFLEENEPYTLFAPTDEAFAQLPDGVIEVLLTEEGRPKLNAILERHLVPDGEVTSDALSDGQSIDPATGEPLTVSISGGEISVGDATVVEPDIQTANGVIHAVDGVLVPDLVIEAMKYREEWPETDEGERAN